MEAYLHDASVWVGIGFLLFVALAAFVIYPKLNVGKALDSYADKIKAEIENAQKLKAEAQELLEAAQKKSATAERNASEIIERAKFEAKLIADEAEKEIEREIERKIKLADEKIARAEAAAVENVRKKAVEDAIAAATEILSKELESEEAAGKQVENSLRLISKAV